MNDKEALLAYRMVQAEETLNDAQKMLENNFSPRSVVNRTYYAMFYLLLALFLKTDINIKTSKHAAVISILIENLCIMELLACVILNTSIRFLKQGNGLIIRNLSIYLLPMPPSMLNLPKIFLKK